MSREKAWKERRKVECTLGKRRQVDSMFKKTEGKQTVCLERAKKTRQCSWEEQIYIIRHFAWKYQGQVGKN